jgi:diadenosine tetraphosphatase ApaH/serine/threonine PP2A family protein phosphatase
VYACAPASRRRITGLIRGAPHRVTGIRVRITTEEGPEDVPKIAACGGPYANPHALAAMLRDARARGCERVFCLGDLGGFGADCDGVWPLLTGHGVECIAGNYDIAIGRGDPDCGCGYSDPRDNHFAQLIYDYTLAHTSRAFASWMAELPGELRETIGGVEVHMVHGSPLAVNDFLWESLDDEELRDRTGASSADVLVCTHTGIPWQRRVDDTLVVNVGAVGRPANDGSPDTWYAVLDLEDGRARAELVQVAYDWRAQAASMRQAGLPEPFVETIETGWWTTCLEVVPAPERSRGRYQLYRDAMPSGFGPDGVSWADAPSADDAERPVVPLFGSGVFPPRLWVYSNFHCNLSCSYCAVASSPAARRRSIGLDRFRALVDEAVDEGFEELYVTGGEPFVEPRIVAMLEYASDRLPTVVLTNAMLFTGRRRRAELERLAGRDGLVLQTSLDGARPETHDRFRGAGSWRKTIGGIEIGRELGLPVRAAMTATDANAGEVDELRALLAGVGVEGADFAVRPLVKRGFADDGLEVSDAVMVPELTITADGAHWHPVGGDIDSSPDLVVARGEVSLAEAKRRIVERFLLLRQRDGSLPEAFQCAV